MTVTINVKKRPYYVGTKSLDGNVYQMKFRWNINPDYNPTDDGYNVGKWYLDMKGLNNSVNINGMALMCGKNLLARYGYRELGELWVIDNSGANEDPNYDDWGGRWTLEYTPLS